MFLKEGEITRMCELDWKEDSEPKRTSLRPRLLIWLQTLSLFSLVLVCTCSSQSRFWWVFGLQLAPALAWQKVRWEDGIKLH